tara:strand:+ start:398 stop:1360 length:963 start_codon:yes stop_codon:yes gene_type:complete
VKIKPIIIVSGEPNSIFLEIFLKSLKLRNYKSPIILISSLKLLKFYMKKFKYQKKINLLDHKNLKVSKLNNKSINLVDVKIKLDKDNKITSKSNIFIKKSFDLGLNIMKIFNSSKFINGPISKKTFLKKKYPGITEYIAQKNKIKKFAMLIYNKELSVCPLTTHMPIKKVNNFITRKNIFEKVILINDFYIKHKNTKPRIGILGLNPHCESTDTFNEDDKILKPAIRSLKKLGFKVSGPYPADTIFLKKNRIKFDSILGMYHDQVLTPMKTLFEYDAINITLGLPFIRISPDHGPNEKMIGKNKSNPLSLIRAIEFLGKN